MHTPIGYVPFHKGQGQGFVWPVFVEEGTKHYLVQVPPSHSFLYPKMKRLHETPLVVLTTPEVYGAALEQFNFGFLFNEARLVVGVREAIETPIRAFCSKPGTNAAVRMQLAELWGSPTEKLTQRLSTIGELRQRYGRETADAFVQSALPQSTLWELISSHSVPTDDIPALTRARAKAVLFLDPAIPELLPPQVWDEIVPFLTVDPSSIIASFWQQCAFLSLSDNDPTTSTPPVEHSIEQLAHQVGGLERQEQRVACVLRNFIDDPTATLWFLANYTDRGAFANAAFGILKSTHPSKHLLASDRGQLVAVMIRKLYTLAFPMQRGVLLYDLAGALRYYSVVADAIRARASGSHSMYVVSVRAAILEALAN